MADEFWNRKVPLNELVFHPTGDVYAGEVVDGVYVAPDGRTAGSVRDGALSLAPWVTVEAEA